MTKNARQKRKCRRKRSYENKSDATHGMNLHVAKHQPTRLVSPYRCKFCGKFHIGHSRKVRG